MNPILAAVSAACLRAPETFETAISAGARHMASERLARDMQGYRPTRPSAPPQSSVHGGGRGGARVQAERLQIS